MANGSSQSRAFSRERHRTRRFQNYIHSVKVYVQLTFFDALSNLRMEFSELFGTMKKMSNAEVAHQCFGTKTNTRTMTMIPSGEVRLPSEVIQVIGEISIEDNPEVCSISKDWRGSHKVSNEAKMTTYSRVYREFVKLESRYPSTMFIVGGSENNVVDEINTL